jgi:hypothetical protein
MENIEVALEIHLNKENGKNIFKSSFIRKMSLSIHKQIYSNFWSTNTDMKELFQVYQKYQPNPSPKNSCLYFSYRNSTV